jgi:hypothetical protein
VIGRRTLRWRFVILLALGFPNFGAACSCIESSTAERFRQSGIVIAAEVTSVQQRRVRDLDDRQPLRLCSGSRTLADAIDVIPELFELAGDPAGTSQHPFRRSVDVP